MGTPELPLFHDGNATVRSIEAVLREVVPIRCVNMLEASRGNDGPASGAVVCVNHATIKRFDLLARSFDVVPDQSVFITPTFSAEYAAALDMLVRFKKFAMDSRAKAV